MKTYWVFMTVEIVAESEELAKNIAACIMWDGDEPLTYTIDNVVEAEKTEDME